MSSLGISNQEIYENLAMLMGANRDPEEWDDQDLADANRVIRAGRRKLFMAHNWAFLENNIQWVTESPTLLHGACVDGVVTVTSGTIPDPIIGYYKIVPQGATVTVAADRAGVFDVAVFDTAGQFTLADTSVDFTAQDIIAYRYVYDLPANFAAFVDPVVVENNDSGSSGTDEAPLTEYSTLPDFQVSGILNRSRIVTGAPEIYAVSSTADDETGDFSFFLSVYPFIPYSATAPRQYVIKTRVKIQPGDALDNDGDVFHPVFSELMNEAILASGEIMIKGAAGVHTQLFGELLPLAVKRDKEMRGVRRLIPKRGRNRRAENSEIRRAEIDLTNALTT